MEHCTYWLGIRLTMERFYFIHMYNCAPFFAQSPCPWIRAGELTNPFCFSSDYQCQADPSLINIKGYGIKSFKVQRSPFASLILLWILQVCCGICPPTTSWSTCWLEKPCRRWLKLSSSPTQAGQTEITQNRVFYLTLISSTMPQDAWGEHSIYKAIVMTKQVCTIIFG